MAVFRRTQKLEQVFEIENLLAIQVAGTAHGHIGDARVGKRHFDRSEVTVVLHKHCKIAKLNRTLLSQFFVQYRSVSRYFLMNPGGNCLTLQFIESLRG